MTYLCMAYGKDPDGFKSFVEAGWLPVARAPNCRREYAQADRAFRTTLLPHIDQYRANPMMISSVIIPTPRSS